MPRSNSRVTVQLSTAEVERYQNTTRALPVRIMPIVSFDSGGNDCLLVFCSDLRSELSHTQYVSRSQSKQNHYLKQKELE